ncbi:MAG: efflux RND transporter periplasmic adaptor subunit [Terriglobales bacterium]
MAKRWLQWLVVVLVAVGVYFGVRVFRAKALAPQVPTVAARQGMFQVTISVRGTLTPARSVEIRAPRISGLIIATLSPNGSFVKQGDVIATFDSGTAKSQQTSDLATLNQTQAQVEQIKATAVITDQQDQLNLTADKNQVAYDKLNVIKEQVISPIAGKEAQLGEGMAEEQLKVEQATIAAHKTSNQAQIATATRAMQKAQADYDLITQQIAEMVVRAPISGIISYLMNFSQGRDNEQPFKVGDSVWGNGTFAQIPDMKTLAVLAKVSEVTRGKIQAGQPYRMVLDSLPEVPVSGTISSISALTEPDFGTTFPPPQVFRVNASIDHISPRMRPSMTGGMDVVTKRIPNAIIVPTEAIFPIEGKPNVYVQHGNNFQVTPVTVLARTADDAAVSGLQAGARVALQVPKNAKVKP